MVRKGWMLIENREVGERLTGPYGERVLGNSSSLKSEDKIEVFRGIAQKGFLALVSYGIEEVRGSQRRESRLRD